MAPPCRASASRRHGRRRRRRSPRRRRSRRSSERGRGGRWGEQLYPNKSGSLNPSPRASVSVSRRAHGGVGETQAQCRRVSDVAVSAPAAYRASPPPPPRSPLSVRRSPPPQPPQPPPAAPGTWANPRVISAPFPQTPYLSPNITVRVAHQHSDCSRGCCRCCCHRCCCRCCCCCRCRSHARSSLSAAAPPPPQCQSVSSLPDQCNCAPLCALDLFCFWKRQACCLWTRMPTRPLALP